MVISRRGTTRVLAYSDSKVFSGAEMIFRDLVASLCGRESFEVVCAAPRGGRMAQALEQACDGPPVIDVPPQALRLAAFDLVNPRRRRRVEAALRGADADVVLVNLPSAEYGGLPLDLRGLSGRRVGLLHVPGSPRELGFRLGRLREALARRVLGGLDCVLVYFDSAADAFAARWDGGGTEVSRFALPRPQPGRGEMAAAREALGLPAGPLAGIAGRVSFRQKGHDTLVAAAGLLSRSRPDLHFAVAGEGRDSDALEELLAQNGLRHRFSLLGHVSPIDTFLSAVDALVIPSRFEGLPVIALEALAAGTPGIASAVDGLCDVWPREWLVAPSEPGELAAALARLLDTSPAERRRLLEAGRSQMERATSADMDAAVDHILPTLAGAG